MAVRVLVLVHVLPCRFLTVSLFDGALVIAVAMVHVCGRVCANARVDVIIVVRVPEHRLDMASRLEICTWLSVRIWLWLFLLSALFLAMAMVMW